MTKAFIVDSNAGISGSLTNLVDGTSYLIAGNGVSISSQSNGSVVIATNASTSDFRFGDGSDGVALFDGGSTPAGSTRNNSGSYTINRDVFYTNMTVNGSVAVNTNGYRVFCNTSALVSGSINNNGNPGSIGAPGVDTPAGTLGSGFGGGNGSGYQSGPITAGQNSANSYGGDGGNNSANSFQGTVSQPTVSQGSVHGMGSALFLLGMIFGISGSTLVNGGAGGGGSSANTSPGGGGGGGGGVLVFATPQLSGTGSISTDGGLGGSSNVDSYFGAGGGGGGVVFFAYVNTGSWTGSITANGGAGGGLTAQGHSGSNGTVFLYNIKS